MRFLNDVSEVAYFYIYMYVYTYIHIYIKPSHLIILMKLFIHGTFLKKNFNGHEKGSVAASCFTVVVTAFFVEESFIMYNGICICFYTVNLPVLGKCNNYSNMEYLVGRYLV